MPWSVPRARRACSPHLACLMLLVVVSLAGGAIAAESLCEPGFVRGPGSNLRPIPADAISPETAPRMVTIRWLGHSSFLIITPGGTTAVTDPHSWKASPLPPDIVTISNDHPTHNQPQSVPGNAQVLRGRTPEGAWIEVNVAIGDLSIKNLPSSGGNALEIPAQNTIFVFRTEGLCIVHLGNLRSPLSDEQRHRLGHPDVLMIPIDGHWTLSYDHIALTIMQLRPAIVLPMHYDFPEHARHFIQFIKDSVPVRTQNEVVLKLTRTTLPSASEVLVLGYHEGAR
jgi:L-ascorbate metabolism protein UlaG (beta-lactamase superfamily)